MKNIELIVTELCDELTWNLVRAFLSSLSHLDPWRTTPADGSPRVSQKRRRARTVRMPSVDARETSRRDLLPSPRRPNARPVDPSMARLEKTPATSIESHVGTPVLRATLPSASTRVLVEAIVDALQDGPLYSEDLRRELHVSRRELARPLAEALKRRRIVKRGDRRLTIYQLA